MTKRKLIAICVLTLMLYTSFCNPLCVTADTITTSSYTDDYGNIIYTTEDGFEYIIENDEITITKYTGNAVDLVIPDYINGLPVTVVGNGYQLCTDDIRSNIKTIKLSDNVITLNKIVFIGFENLKEIYLNEGLKYLKNSCLACCYNIEKITFPESIIEYNGCFTGGDSLKELNVFSPYIDLTDGVSFDVAKDAVITGYYNTNLQIFCKENNIKFNSLGNYIPEDFAFEYVLNKDDTATITGCNFKYIVDLNIPETIDGHTITAVGDSAFYENYIYLKNVTMADTIKSIGNWSFAFCPNLETIKLSNGIEELNTYEHIIYEEHSGLPATTFYVSPFYCNFNLKKLIYPNNVKYVDREAFGHCDKLEKLILPSSVTEIHKEAFTNSGPVTIYTYPDSYALQFAKENNKRYKIIGDISEDENIDSSDALSLLQNTTNTKELTDEQTEICDFDFDGQITSADALRILQYIVGSINSLY